MSSFEQLQKPARDLRHINITSDKLRAMLHEAWKHGNDSYNVHSERAGTDERYLYVDQVMIEKGFKRST